MKKLLAPVEKIENKILNIRGKSVMLDRDLAALYGVEVRALNQAVKRNPERFPSNFMFQLCKEEWEILRSQIVIFKNDGRKFLPYAFTEQGVAMLSSVLKSKRAIVINIEIMNTFVAVRQYVLKTQNDERMSARLGVVEKALLQYMEKNDKRVDDVIAALNSMMKAENKKELKKIGFVP
ncbi:MAG: ORF6N domain-containing protein [Elusimicrobium sp.]|jgi:hypothetical protein|nr:ORF6N domain-containing protein [Elusimicrobium sp.]